MNFLTKEQYLDCLSRSTLYECVQMFWNILLNINPAWQNLSTLTVSKKEWDKLFVSIDGLPFSRDIPTKVVGDEDVRIRMKALKGRPEYSWHPSELFVYPLAIPLWSGQYKSSRGSKKVIHKHLIHLDEIRALIKRPLYIWIDEWEHYIVPFDHKDPKYHDLDAKIEEAAKNLRRLQVLKNRADLRKR